MKTLGAFAIFAALVVLPMAGCGYHHHSFRDRAEIRRAHEDFRRAGWEAREELRRARQDVQRELRQAREDFRREMRQAHRELRDEFGRW
jgi:outer membrane lipopolysaccharide assembly protein LptE/RlpB